MPRILRSIAFIGVLGALLCGCVPHTELNEKAIVEALGIDYGENGYEVTVQYCNLTSSGGQSKIDITQPNTLTATGNGKNVYSALKNAELKIGRELMMGINQLIVLGSETVKKDLSDVLSFATTYSQIHPNMLVCTAGGKGFGNLLGKIHRSYALNGKADVSFYKRHEVGRYPLKQYPRPFY